MAAIQNGNVRKWKLNKKFFIGLDNIRDHRNIGREILGKLLDWNPMVGKIIFLSSVKLNLKDQTGFLWLCFKNFEYHWHFLCKTVKGKAGRDSIFFFMASFSCLSLFSPARLKWVILASKFVY